MGENISENPELSRVLRHDTKTPPEKKKKKSNLNYTKGFPGDSAGKESACNVEDLGSIPGEDSL